ncbi:MAG: FkbM family methyltransferase, partial [Chloroflexota bacterium]
APSRGVEVTCLNAAVAATSGDLEFVVPRQNSGAARAASSAARDVGFLDLAGANRITVRSRPLDALLAEQPGTAESPIDLLKVDVEGFEAECFAGASSTLARTRRVIFEFHSQALLEECSRLLRTARLRQVSLHRNPTNPEQGMTFWRPIS